MKIKSIKHTVIFYSVILLISLIYQCTSNGDTNSNMDNTPALNCEGDGDDNISCATPLNLGKPIHSTISIESDVDYYSFSVLDKEGTYSFLIFDQAANLCNIDSILILYKKDGTTVLSANNDASSVNGPVPDPCSSIDVTFPSMGKYYLRVSTSNLNLPKTGPYSIQAFFTPDYIARPAGILTHWTLDAGNGGATDSMGRLDLTRYGTLLPAATGIFNLGRGPFSFSNYYYAFKQDNLQFLRKQYFIAEVWFKTSSTATQGIIGNYYYNTGWGLEILSSDRKLRWTLGKGYCNPTCYYTGSSGATVTDGQWHYAVLARINTNESTNTRLYLDGVRQANGDFWVSNFTTDKDIYIGKLRGSASAITSTYSFSGVLDDILFWHNPPTTWAEVNKIVANRWSSGSPKYYK